MKVQGKKFFLICILLSLSMSLFKSQEDYNEIDPSLEEEENATGMENVGNGDELQDEAINENQINPQEEEEINQAMGDEGMTETGNMFGGGEDAAMMNKMGVNPETPDDAAEELEHAEEHLGHEHNEHGEHVDPAVEHYFDEEERNNNHEEIDPNISEENLDHEHEYQGDDEIPGDQIIDHGLVAMEHHTELEKMKNFKKISDDCKIFLEQFRDCLDNIPDPAWDEREIQKCVGKDFTRVVNDICKSKF